MSSFGKLSCKRYRGKRDSLVWECTLPLGWPRTVAQRVLPFAGSNGIPHIAASQSWSSGPWHRSSDPHAAKDGTLCSASLFFTGSLCCTIAAGILRVALRGHCDPDSRILHPLQQIWQTDISRLHCGRKRTSPTTIPLLLSSVHPSHIHPPR